MSNQPTMQRMPEILALLSGNIMYSISKIAKKKNISERTVYRYDTLAMQPFTAKQSENHTHNKSLL